MLSDKKWTIIYLTKRFRFGPITGRVGLCKKSALPMPCGRNPSRSSVHQVAEISRMSEFAQKVVPSACFRQLETSVGFASTSQTEKPSLLT